MRPKEDTVWVRKLPVDGVVEVEGGWWKGNGLRWGWPYVRVCGVNWIWLWSKSEFEMTSGEDDE